MPQAIVAIVAKVGFAAASALGMFAGGTAVAASTIYALGGAIIAGTALVAKKVMTLFEIEMPKIDTDRSRQSTVRSTTEPHKIIYGETLVSGPIVYANVAGTDNKHLYHAIALAAHEVEAITDIYLDNELIANADIAATTTTAATSGRVTGSGTFAPIDGTTICHINKHLGTSTQAADSLLRDAFSSAWTTSHQGKGIAYIVTKFVLNDDSAEVWDKYAPNNIKAVVKGRKIYDPRLDSTQTAISGSGSHRLADSTTWAYSTNPALAVADYLMNADFGLGVSSSKIDWAAIKTAADACDASVSVPGGTESRFTCNGVLFGTDSHKTNINKLLSAMNGNMAYIDGYYVVRAGIYEAHVLDLDEDDLAGSIGIKTSLERSDRFNTVKGVFIDPASNFKSTEFPKVQLSSAYDRDNQEELHKEIALNMTNSSFMAQRIAHKLIQQSNHQKIVTYPTNMKGLRVAVGDRVRITNTELGWTNKVYQCVQWSFNEEGGVTLTLREDAQANYADPTVTPNNEYSEITSDGTLTDAFRGVPAPSGLRAVSAEGKVFLDWVNPGIPEEFQTVHVLVSSDSNLSNAVKAGETDGTQFVHDSNNAATDATKYADGDTRYYWVRAVNFVGTSAQAQSSAHGSQSVTITSDVDWGNIADPTIGIQLDTDDSIQIVYNAETQTSGSAIATSGIEEDVTITQGGITMSNGGAIRGGQTAFNSGTGFFLGYDSSAYKFSIGNSGGEKLTFDGSNLSVTGAVNASSGDFSGQVAVGSTAGTITVIDGNDTDYRLFTNATLDTDTNQYLPDDSSFKVGNDGRVFASNITIYNDDGDVLLSPSGLGAAALNDISTTSGQVVSTVGGTVSNSTSEITLTTSSASESFTITSKVAINDNYDITQYFSGASTSSTANAEAQLTGVDVLIDYYVKADGGSYGASPDVTKTVTIVNSGTPTSTQMRVGGFDRGASYSGSLTRYFALLQDFGGALEIIPNSGGGASSYVVTTASLGSSLFPSAQTYKIKIVMRVVEDGTTTVISGSTTPPSSDNTTTGIYFDGGNSDERHYEITGTGLIKNSDNNFTSGSQNLLSSGGTISGNLTVTGDFTVQGTTTTLDTATLNVEDKNITLNYSTGDSSGSADGAGITIQDAVNSSTDATLNWNATNDRWEFSHQMKTPSLMVGAKERIDGDGDLNNIRNINASGELENRGGAYLEIQSQQDGGSGRGIYIWDYTDSNWVIYMGQAGSGKAADGGTAASGIDGRTGHAIRYRVNDSTSQIGHLFENSSDEALVQITPNNGDILSRGVYYPNNQTTDYVNSSRIQNWQTAYTYSQVGHVPLAGGTMTGALSIGGSSTNGISLRLRSGDSSTGTDSTQIRLGYSNSDNYSQRIATRHNSSESHGNAIDFYVWNYGTDAAGDLPTKRVLVVDGYDEGVIYTPNLGVNTTDNTVLAGTQVYIKKRDANHNLMRWGEGDVNNADSYRFRIDQTFNFIADGGNGGTSDTFSLSSATGDITGKGNWSTTGTFASGAQNITHTNSTIGLANAALKITNTGSQSMIYFTDGTNADGSIRVDQNGNVVFNSRNSRFYFDYDFGSDPKFYNAGDEFLSLNGSYATLPSQLIVQQSQASGSYLSDGLVYSLKVQNPDTTAGNATAIAFGHGGYSFTSYIASIRKGTGANPWGDISIGGRPADATTFVDRLYIEGDTGNVSIGRTYADGKLHVYNTGASTDVYIDNRKSYGSGNANDSVAQLFLSISENDSTSSADNRKFAMFKAGTLSDSTSANGYAQIGVRYNSSIENLMLGDGNAGTSFLRDGGVYYKGMQRGSIEIGSTARSFKYTSGWSSSMQGGILANTQDDWEFVIHDSSDALASAFVYDNAGANVAGDFTLGRDLGWGGSRIFIADQLIAARGGTTSSNASASAIFGKLNASSHAVLITNHDGEAHTWFSLNDGANYITTDGTDTNPYTYFRNYTEPGGTSTYAEYMRVGASKVEVMNGSKLIIRDTGTANTNGAALNIAAGSKNQVNINSSGESTWGLLIGYGDGTDTGAYHGNNHAAIINVQAAPLHLGTSNASQMRIRSDGGVEMDNRVYFEGGAYWNHVANVITSISNADAGATNFTHRGNRLLTSNGTNWAADGRDPMFAFTESTTATTIGGAIGITMHNEQNTTNAFSPMIAFSSKSNSNNYNSAYAGILGRKIGTGVDTNWNAGELWFYAMPGGAYASNLPNMRIIGNDVEINGSTNSGNDTTLIIRGHHTNSVEYDPVLILKDHQSAGSEGIELWYDNNVGNSYLTAKYATGDFHIGAGSGTTHKSTSHGRVIIRGEGDVIFGNASVGPYISATNENTLNASWGQQSDSADMWINYRGQLDGINYFRDFRIGDGKNVALVHLDGSARRWTWENGTEQFNWEIHADSDSASTSWDNLNFQATTEWGDAASYGVLGGSVGVMLRRPHVVWSSGASVNSVAGAADIRFGRSGGTSSGDWYGVGTIGGDVFSIHHNGTSVLKYNGASRWDFLDNTIMFDGSTNRQITGATTNGYNSVDIYGNWDRFQIMGRVLDWSASNLHFGDGYNGVNHGSYYVQFGVQTGLNYFRVGTDIYADGNVIAYYSDARLKQKVETIPNALDIVKAIRGVYFEWNELSEKVWSRKAGEKDFGLISQEVEAVFPMGVAVQCAADKAKEMGYSDPESEHYDPLHHGDNEEEEYKTVKYDKMVAVAIQAINEQQSIIESQQAQIDELKTLINKLMEK